jgi:hypothetical protein
MGDKIYDRLKDMLREIIRQNSEISCKNNFVYSGEVVVARKPNPLNEETIREIEYIAPEEIQDAMVKITKAHSGVTIDCLYAETLKFFGFKRQTDAVVNSLKQNLRKLLASERLIDKGDFLVIVEIVES